MLILRIHVKRAVAATQLDNSSWPSMKIPYFSAACELMKLRRIGLRTHPCRRRRSAIGGSILLEESPPGGLRARWQLPVQASFS